MTHDDSERFHLLCATLRDAEEAGDVLLAETLIRCGAVRIPPPPPDPPVLKPPGYSI